LFERQRDAQVGARDTHIELGIRPVWPRAGGQSNLTLAGLDHGHLSPASSPGSLFSSVSVGTAAAPVVGVDGDPVAWLSSHLTECTRVRPPRQPARPRARPSRPRLWARWRAGS